MKKKKIFEAKNISTYTLEGKEILKNISFYINQGEKVLLEGENGIGKSTIMNSIFKNPNYKIESEYIHFVQNDNNIIDIKDYNTYEIAKIGMFYNLQTVPEIPGLSTIKFLYKAYQNIHIQDKNLGIVDFKNLLLKYCSDFDIDSSLVERDLNVGFSGGEKKQSMLLHLLILNPKVIFVDEPESGVDKNATEKVYKVLNYLVKNGSSLFIISHNEKTQTKLKIDRKYVLKYNKDLIKVLEEVVL